MRLTFSGDLTELEQGIQWMAQEWEETEEGASPPVPVEAVRSPAGLEVRYDGRKAVVRYRHKAEFFRGISLLRECASAGAPAAVSETPKFRMAGVMLDCSRNAVPTVDAIKRWLRKMAAMGLNTLFLYMEDMYEVKGEPYFGYMRGRYTFSELKECDDYAHALGIEVVPCIQTLAHLSSFLKWDSASGLRDTEDVLLVDHPETYRFLENVIAAAAAPFRSRKVHIGMDEAHGLGLGRYLTMSGYKPKHELMRSHLHRVLEITAKLGLEPMMWGDMYFRMAIPGGGYYDPDVVLADDVKRSVVPGVNLTYWDYYHNDEEFYLNYIGKYKELGGVPSFCGGVCTWGSMFPNYPKTLLAGKAALSACRRAGVEDVYVSLWNDSGETLYFASLMGLALYAEMNYAEQFREETFRRRVKTLTGVDYEDFMALGSLDDIAGRGGHGVMLEPSNPQRYLLWQDLLLGLFDRHVEGLDTRGHFRGFAEKLDSCAAKYGHLADMSPVFETAAKLARVLEMKADAGVRLKAAYDARDRRQLREMAERELPELRSRVLALREAHRRAWFGCYKAFGWEVLDIRYGGLIMRIDTAVRRLNDYLEGRCASLEELEAERLTYDGFSHETTLGHYNRYTRMATPGVFY